MRKLLGLFLIAVVGLAAQSQAPVPIAAPPDVLTSQAAAASALTSYKGWVETSLASHDATIQTLWSAKVADEATIQFQSDHLTRQDAQIATMQAQIATLQAQLMPVIPAVLHIEAESASASSSSIFKQATTDAGGGENLSNIVNGQWFEYHINVPVAGAYTMTLRAASPHASETVHVECTDCFKLNANDHNSSGAVAIPNTGGYQVWTTAPVGQPITFPQGTVVFRVVCDTGALNLNWFEFTRN